MFTYANLEILLLLRSLVFPTSRLCVGTHILLLDKSYIVTVSRMALRTDTVALIVILGAGFSQYV